MMREPLNSTTTSSTPDNSTHGVDTGRVGSVTSYARLREMSEDQFHGFLEENPDAIIIVDQTGHINFASNRIEAIFGHLPDGLFGKPLSVLMPERYRDLHLGHLSRSNRVHRLNLTSRNTTITTIMLDFKSEVDFPILNDMGRYDVSWQLNN